MLKIRLTALSAALVTLSSIAIPAQVSAKLAAIVSDEPVLNAPYSAKRRFTSIKKLADGKISRIESGGSEARDSHGRAYSAGERSVTYFDGKKNVLKSEMLYRIDDPVANTETKWDTTSKVVKVIHWPQRESNEDASATKCFVQPCDGLTMSTLDDLVENLGTKNIGGFVAEGTLSSYTVPAGRDHNIQPIVVVHERWYCPELKIVILETNDDPRRGTTRNELIDIARGEPDITKYRPPADYVVRQIEIPQ